MPKYANLDHYLDPDTGILKNKLGIRDEATLATAEADYVAARSYELSQNPIDGKFDLAHLQSIHRHLFGDVYDWAGALRDVDISKGQSYFAHYRYIEAAAAPLFEQLAKENYLAGQDTADFSERAAYFLGELTRCILSVTVTDARSVSLSGCSPGGTDILSPGRTSPGRS